MSKLTDAEILKALECCANEEIDCEDCPSKKCCDGDTFEMVKAVLDLINRQKAEIERLKGDNDILSKNLHNLCKELEAEKIRNF